MKCKYENKIDDLFLIAASLGAPCQLFQRAPTPLPCCPCTLSLPLSLSPVSPSFDASAKLWQSLTAHSRKTPPFGALGSTQANEPLSKAMNPTWAHYSLLSTLSLSLSFSQLGCVFVCVSKGMLHSLVHSLTFFPLSLSGASLSPSAHAFSGLPCCSPN